MGSVTSAASAASHTLAFDLTLSDPVCQGTGVANYSEACAVCGGTGQITVHASLPIATFAHLVSEAQGWQAAQTTVQPESPTT